MSGPNTMPVTGKDAIPISAIESMPTMEVDAKISSNFCIVIQFPGYCWASTACTRELRDWNRFRKKAETVRTVLIRQTGSPCRRKQATARSTG
jgi:hypothetical protein